MTRAFLRRAVAAVATTLTAALVLSGCLYSQIPQVKTSPSQAPSTVGVPVGLEDFYSQTLDWRQCENVHTCAEVEVPVNYDDPSGRTIEIAVIRASATSGSPQGSLLTNPGGPGGSGYDFIASSLSYAVGESVRSAYDVIGFDPRGVGRSAPVGCLTGAAKDAYLYDVSDTALFSEEWWAEGEAEAKSYAQACEAASDGLLPYISTENSARDMDVIRAVLGDDDLSYLGYSYGTRLGGTYARLFPERADRLVLDGAIDPSLSSFDDSVSQAGGFETALRNYMTWCLKQKDCAFRGTLDQALADVTVLLESLQRDPIAAPDGRRVDGYAMALAIFTTLYSQDYWSYLTAAFTGALAGKGEDAMMLVDSYNGRTGPGEYADNSLEAFTAYNCVDKPSDYSRDETLRLRDAVAKVAPTFADFWVGPDVCAFWTAPATGTPGAITAEGSDPIVVIGTTGDPATPYEEAVALADQLASGVLITRVGEGHTGYNKGSACVDDAVDAFLIDGVVPENGLRCS